MASRDFTTPDGLVRFDLDGGYGRVLLVTARSGCRETATVIAYVKRVPDGWQLQAPGGEPILGSPYAEAQAAAEAAAGNYADFRAAYANMLDRMT